MKAIETRYDNYRFRSRLEARWAVFFTAMDWPYRYEPEGFVLAQGSWYLPDFYLPKFDVWIEIKGATPTEKEKQTSRLFQAAGQSNYIIAGDVYAEEHSVFFFEGGRDGAGDMCIDAATFARCRRCQRGVWLTGDSAAICLSDCSSQCHTERWPLPTDDIMAAYAKARSARFEHGENPEKRSTHR